MGAGRLWREQPQPFAGCKRSHHCPRAVYIAAQFAGGLAGIGLVAFFANAWVSHPSVGHVATLPGVQGNAAAFAGELTHRKPKQWRSDPCQRQHTTT